MTLATFLLFAALFALPLDIYIVYRAVRRIRELRRETASERVRSGFAEARIRLMRLVISAELDSRSETFQALYHIQTALLRRPDEYHRIVPIILKSIAKDANKGGPLWEEAKAWTPEVSANVGQTLEAIHNLFTQYSFTYRQALKVLGVAAANPKVVALILPRRKDRKSYRDYKELRDRFGRLCHA